MYSHPPKVFVKNQNGRLRVSNVGSAWNWNKAIKRIQNLTLVLCYISFVSHYSQNSSRNGFIQVLNVTIGYICPNVSNGMFQFMIITYVCGSFLKFSFLIATNSFQLYWGRGFDWPIHDHKLINSAEVLDDASSMYRRIVILKNVVAIRKMS